MTTSPRKRIDKARVAKLWRLGARQSWIAHDQGVSRQRVHQVLRDADLLNLKPELTGFDAMRALDAEGVRP